ncbi:hypothetical protein F4777DRAFT_342131 [Nemania sp. FL0916]|nr:hypothetical protein F4777DRAFT_342131 [Nemania sp. FL0916]
MDILPSYSEATSRLDWLSLVAPFVPAFDWASCCLVDRRFYGHFAPRLWRDPLVTIRQLGLHANDDLAWYRRFIHKHAGSARVQTRSIVRSLDFRAFALTASGLYSTEASERAISDSFKALHQLFPQLMCLLLDGHPELDPSSLSTTEATTIYSLQLLDFARCRQELSPKLFCSQLFRDLVFLDVSYIPGSMKTAIQSSLNPVYLPNLRVLKAQGREVDDNTAKLLFQSFRLQLWSLDLSHNQLTDDSIDVLLTHCFSSLSLRSESHFEVEGKVVTPRSLGTHQYGPFEFIQESSHSARFAHPERHLADPPVYSRRADQVELQEWQTTRSDGIAPTRRDDASATKETLLENALPSAGTSLTRLPQDVPRGGITHLYLDCNGFTGDGIARLLRISSGRLEHFSCDSCRYNSSLSLLDEELQQLRIRGMFQLPHLFRPVFSSSLRSLRIHHSLVTQVPEILARNISPMSAQRLSETVIFRNISRVYPQRFLPDMNPRIVSLALTNIPARSIGPVIEQLTSFLDFVSLQQATIRRLKSNLNGRHTTVLTGLRHIRLELDPDFSDDAFDTSTGHDTNYDKLLDPGDDNFNTTTFSFFEHTKRTDQARRDTGQGANRRAAYHNSMEQYSRWKSGRLKSPPYSDTETEFINHHFSSSVSLTGNVFSIPVWIGPGTIGRHAAVNEYMWNLQDVNLRTDVGPATPNHVAAGVPPLVYIFYAAWDAMVLPKSLDNLVKNTGSEPFRDVATAIKEYRLRTKGTPRHWDGKLELVRTSPSSRYHASEYWR